jgi:methionyl-tRNA formyltransferase
MEVAIIGRTQFLYDSALNILDQGHSIPVIITAPPAPEYTKTEEDFEKLAAITEASFFLSKSLDDPRILSAIQGLDIGVSVNWLSVIRQKHIDCFKLGILNAHMGDLPRYRGNACPNWAIINEEKEIGFSIHFMEGGRLDCGRIVVQKKLSLNDDIYIADVYRWAEKVLPNSFAESLSLLKKDQNYMLKYADPDSPHSLRCYPRVPEDSRINWNDPAKKIRRLIRASSRPFSGAFTFLDSEKATIWRAELYRDNEKLCAIPGQICEIEQNYFVVITGKGKLKITEWNCEKKIRSIRQRLI